MIHALAYVETGVLYTTNRYLPNTSFLSRRPFSRMMESRPGGAIRSNNANVVATTVLSSSLYIVEEIRIEQREKGVS